jgi:hypothetical protein
METPEVARRLALARFTAAVYGIRIGGTLVAVGHCWRGYSGLFSRLV